MQTGIMRHQKPEQKADKLVLGVESSCDETAVALVRLHTDGCGEVLANKIYTQLAEHQEFGGVVPEIAARAHLQKLSPLVHVACDEAGVDLGQIDAVAATAGPGLLGGVLVGLTLARGLAYGLGKPILNINHLEGHALTALLSERGLDFPFLLLLVSGGHAQLVWVRGLGVYDIWGTTIDDALGEAFDKVAKLLGLGYPGGPLVENYAKGGDEARFSFPRPLIKAHLLTKKHDKNAPHLIEMEDLNFSFSGLKTAVRRTVEKLAPISEQDVADICASFQAAICDCLTIKTAAGLQKATRLHGQPLRLVVAGGVAANQKVGAVLKKVAFDFDATLFVPPVSLCTDNAVMIAWAGALRFAQGQRDGLHEKARARWPLDELTPPIKAIGL